MRHHILGKSLYSGKAASGLTVDAPQDVITAATVLGAAEICNVYGQTESYGNCCVTPHHWPLEQRATCQGPPMPGVQIRIVHPETAATLPSGEVGVIEVRGYITRGYQGSSASQNTSALCPRPDTSYSPAACPR